MTSSIPIEPDHLFAVAEAVLSEVETATKAGRKAPDYSVLPIHERPDNLKQYPAHSLRLATDFLVRMGYIEERWS